MHGRTFRWQNRWLPLGFWLESHSAWVANASRCQEVWSYSHGLDKRGVGVINSKNTGNSRKCYYLPARATISMRARPSWHLMALHFSSFFNLGLKKNQVKSLVFCQTSPPPFGVFTNKKITPTFLFWKWTIDAGNKFYTWSHQQISLFASVILVYICFP